MKRVESKRRIGVVVMAIVFAMFFALGSFLMVRAGVVADAKAAGEVPETSAAIAPTTYGYQGTVVYYTAPFKGYYKLETWGASGSYNPSVPTYRARGAYAVSYVLLQKGDKVAVMVGQAGGYGSNAGGGGGGTFLALGANYATARQLCVAGGGGGMQYSQNAASYNYAHGQATTRGGLATTGSGGTAGVGYGGYGNIISGAAGGGGFYGSGQGTSNYGKSGNGFRHGGAKVDGTAVAAAYGGYGGGGSTHGNSGGGGGGGGYTGGGGGNHNTPGCGGGGGSYHTGTWQNHSSTAIAGYSSMPNTAGTGTMVGNSGDGYAKITLLAPPSQSAEVNLTGLNRGVEYIYDLQAAPLNGATANRTGHLNGIDQDKVDNISNDYVRIQTEGIVYTDGTTSATEPTNGKNASEYFKDITAAVDGTSIKFTPNKDFRDTKTFWIKVKDSLVNGSSYTDKGESWFKFTATMTGGSFALYPEGLQNEATQGAGKTLEAADYILTADSGIIMTDPVKMAPGGDNYKAGKVFNPLSTDASKPRNTLFIKAPISAGKATYLNVASLFDVNSKLDNKNLDRMVIAKAEAYGDASTGKGFTRYGYSSTNPGAVVEAAEALKNYVKIDKAGDGSWDGWMQNPYNTKGSDVLALQGMGKSAGQFYYIATLTIKCYDIYSNVNGNEESATETTLDVVFRIDNTRPTFAGAAASEFDTEPKAVTLKNGGVATVINLDSVIFDPDGDVPTIVDVKVPTNEYVALDKYGNVIKLKNSSIYNYGVLNGDGSTQNTQLLGDELTETAEQAGQPTGFYQDAIFGTNGSGKTIGGIDKSFVQFSFNDSSITLTGLKATKNMYANLGKNRADKTSDYLGHFYLMIKVIDPGERVDPATGKNEDQGIWYPIAVRVVDAAPTVNGTPSGESRVGGDTILFTPMGVKDNSGDIVGVGSASIDSSMEPNGTVSGKKVMPLSVDNDVMRLEHNKNEGAAKIFYNKKFVDSNIFSAGKVDFMMTDFTFLAKNAANDALFSTSNLEEAGFGYKQFFTFTPIDLYARGSVLAFLTDSEIKTLVSNGFITLLQSDKLTVIDSNMFDAIDGSDASKQVAFIKFTGVEVTCKRSTQDYYLQAPIDVIGFRDALTASATPTSATVSASIKVGDNVATLRTDNTYNGISRDGRTFGAYSVADSAYVYTMYVNDKFSPIKINAYDIFADIDTAYGINEGGAYNSNIVNTGNRDLYDSVNKTYAVTANKATSGAFAKIDLTRDKFSFANTNPTYNSENVTITYNNESVDEKTFESFTITPKSRSSSGITCSFSFDINTSSAAGTNNVESAKVIIVVKNTAPKSRVVDKVNVLDQCYNVSATPEFGDSSATVGGDEKAKDEFNVEYFRLNNGTFNSREFLLNDLLADDDKDIIDWASESVQVGTKVDGEFVAFSAKENVYLEARRATGTNSRRGLSVLYIKGLSSSQGLEHGLFVKFYVTDGYEVDMPVIMQIEVINTAPEVSKDGFVESVDGEKTEQIWQSQNLTYKEGETIKVKPYYIAPDKASMSNLVAATSGGLAYNEKNNVRYIISDLDRGQGFNLDGFNYAVLKLGVTNLTAPKAAVGTADIASNNVAVMVSSPYATEPSGYLKINFFYDDEREAKLYGKKKGDVISTSDTNMTTGKYNVLCNETTSWVVVITPGEVFSTPLEVKIRLRDASRPVYIGADLANNNDGTLIGNSGGNSMDTAETRSAYNGLRTEPKVAIGTSVTAKFKIALTTKKLINNFSAFNDADPKYDKTWFMQSEIDPSKNIYYDEANVGITSSTVKRYSGLSVNKGNEVFVPISYFAWPGANSTGRGDKQEFFASYATNTFNPLEFTTDIQTNILNSITLSDGIYEWTGSDLVEGKNPYVSITPKKMSAGSSGDITTITNSPYLNETRYLLDSTTDNATLMAFDGGSGTGAARYFYEDLNGLTIKKTGIRSAGNLTLKIKLRPFKREGTSGAYAYKVDKDAAQAETVNDILANIPIFV